jgi:hypothetical protein
MSPSPKLVLWKAVSFDDYFCNATLCGDCVRLWRVYYKDRMGWVSRNKEIRLQKSEEVGVKSKLLQPTY